MAADSLGRNQEAYDIYKRIETHPAPGVAKKAKRWVGSGPDHWRVGGLLSWQVLAAALLPAGFRGVGAAPAEPVLPQMLSRACRFTACSMLFGWKAAENLKTTRLSYQPTTAQWKR